MAHIHAPGSTIQSPARQFEQWARRLRDDPDSEDTQELAAFLRRHGHRIDEATWLNSPELVLAWAMANQDVLKNPANLPAHFSLTLLDTLRAKVLNKHQSGTLQGLRLRQQDGYLCFDLCDTAALPQAATGPANVLAQWAAQPVLQWRSSASQRWQRVAFETGMPKIDLTRHRHIELTDGLLTCVVVAALRPAWALEWARDREGLYALAPNPWGAVVRVPFTFTDAVHKRALFQTRDFDGQGGRKTDAVTLDLDAVGLMASLTIEHTHTQSFRYLPPGQFQMGSPEYEPEREDDEGPQHRVTLTEGLWLADTACTQELWLAVMGGKNSSEFNGKSELPVESVSWDDVQTFLAKLQEYLPVGIEAVLPTEAQWEYACRAGSSTPFSFGEQISTDQVNYDGNYPYGNGPKGQYRDKTVPVKALPANAWGLYQMHGNVWEWCADPMRQYRKEAVTNPSGEIGKGAEHFAVRGGSWIDLAQRARSARRFLYERGARDCDFGFRFALRSTGRVGAGGPVFDGQRPFQERDGSVLAARSASRKK